MSTIANYLKEVPLFAGLSEQERERIAATCYRKTYRGRVSLFHKGDTGGQLYIVLRGVVKIFNVSPDTGQEKTIALLTSGEVFGEMALLTEGVRTASAITFQGDTELLQLDNREFAHLLRSSFDLIYCLLRNMASRLNKANEDHLPGSSLSRVAKLLLAMADPYSGRISPSLPQAEIAHFIGVTRETVARNLLCMEQSGYLKRNRGDIIITNRIGLERIVPAN